MSSWRSTGLLLALGACQAATPPPVAPAAPRALITDGVVDAGGVSLHIHCVGAGSPVVVLDAGLGDDGSVWSEVQPELGRLTRACAYDRAGTGYSGAAPRPHTTRQMVGELRALLERAGLAGPYVLVGHSLGGLNARLYAREFPGEVAGMVLVDASTEEQDARLWSLIPGEDLRAFQASLREHPEGLDLDSFRAGMAAVRGAKLGGMPLVVLTRGKEPPAPPSFTAELQARMAQAWREMQLELPGLSSNSAHVIAEDSGHYVQRDAPRLVIAAVREVVGAARSHARVDAARLSSLAREGAP